MVPQKIVAGDSLIFEIDSFTDNMGRIISSTDWALNFSIRGSGSFLDSVASTSSLNWKFTISADDTSSLVVGKAFYQVFATKGVEKITVFAGGVVIDRNLFDADGSIDNRSQNQKDLDAVQTLIRQIVANGGSIEYKIGTRQLKRYEMSDLLTLESRLKYQISLEQKSDRIASGLGNPHNLKVRF